MREQGDGQAKRGYRKGKRAADEARTRTRIVDAAEHLHGTVGPARTTIAAVAAGAHVTRATVYRHFADEESLFLACSSQWLARQDLPRPAAWRLVGDPAGRLRRGLADIYRYYRSGEEMLSLVVRDVEAVPAVVAAARRSREREWVTTLLSAYPGVDAPCSGRLSPTPPPSRPGSRSVPARTSRTDRPSSSWSAWWSGASQRDPALDKRVSHG